MPEYTGRLGLILPGEGEGYSVAQFNDNAKNLDAATDFTVCTSTTRPASPYAGQKILETDTKRTLYHDGTRWIFMNTPITSGVLINGFTGSASWIRQGDMCYGQMHCFIGAGGPLGAWDTFGVANGFPRPRYATDSSGGYDTGLLVNTNAFEHPTLGVYIDSTGQLKILARWQARSWADGTWMRSQFSYFTQNDDTL